MPGPYQFSDWGPEGTALSTKGLEGNRNLDPVSLLVFGLIWHLTDIWNPNPVTASTIWTNTAVTASTIWTNTPVTTSTIWTLA